MTTERYSEIFKLAASTENTVELQSYWQKRYMDLHSNNLFTLSQKTEELILTTTPIDRPSTTFGELNLINHLDERNNFDEVKLQSTIECAIRLLDSLLEITQFTPEAHRIVNQYRKIGLGISNFNEYIQKKQPSSELDEIDYIGNIISGNCYRASESLAEEKGTCGSWDKIKLHLRPKSFEYWYNTESGEIKNGLEMSEEYDQDNVASSRYQIVPRRNSHILLFPAELEWQIWSDRDETAPPTELTDPAPSAPLSNLAPEKPIQVSSAEAASDITQSEPTLGLETPEIENKVEEQKVIEISSDEPKIEEAQNIPVQIDQSDQPTSPAIQDKLEVVEAAEPHNILPIDLPPAQPVKEIAKEVSSMPEPASLHFDLRPVQVNGSGMPVGDEMVKSSQSIKAEPDLVPAENNLNNTLPAEIVASPSEKTESQFQIGELVQIQSPKSEFVNQVFQVGDILHDHNEFNYKLIGHEKVEQKIWSEDELKAVDLFDILDKINLQPAPESSKKALPVRQVYVHALWPGARDELLVETSEGLNQLPGGELPLNEAPEQALLRILNEKYNLKGRIADDLGSSLSLNTNQQESALHLGFLVEGQVAASETLGFRKMAQLGEIPTYFQVLVNKFNRRLINKLNWEQKLQNLEKTYIAQIRQIEDHLAKQESILQERQNVAESGKAQSEENPVEQELNSENHKFTQNPNMSKYALKLEQLVQTNAFGDVTVTIQYDSEGPKLISVGSDKLTPELSHLLETFLAILNFMLARKVGASEIAELIEKEPQDGVHLQINDLLKVVAVSLKEAPMSVNNIKPEILEDVVPVIQEMSKTAAPAQQPPAPAAPAKKYEAPEPGLAEESKPNPEVRNFNPFGNRG